MERELLIELVTKAQNGDSSAMDELFAAFYNDVYYFALKTLKDSDLACDITQETFLEIIKTIGNLKEPVAFVTWMKQITYHQCTRYFKKKKEVLVEEDEEGLTVFDTLEDESEDSVPAEVYEKEEFRNTILEMVNNLSEEQRSAVMMYYFDEMPVGKIAEVQEVSEGTVKSRLNYARKAMKKSVEDYEKKNGIKLHSFGMLPLFALFFKMELIPAEKLSGIKEAVSEALGALGAVGAGAAAAEGIGAAAAAEGSSAAAASAGIGAKIAALPIVTKAVAGVAAVAVTAGVGVAAYNMSNPVHIPEDINGDCVCDCKEDCDVEIHHFNSDSVEDHAICIQCGGRFFNYDIEPDNICDICFEYRCGPIHQELHEDYFDRNNICDFCGEYDFRPEFKIVGHEVILTKGTQGAEYYALCINDGLGEGIFWDTISLEQRGLVEGQTYTVRIYATGPSFYENIYSESVEIVY